jgi:hypothetical protein
MCIAFLEQLSDEEAAAWRSVLENRCMFLRATERLDVDVLSPFQKKQRTASIPIDG